MKSLEQIKSEVFALEIWTIHEDLDEVINEVAKCYAKEVAREALKNASNNARLLIEVHETNSIRTGQRAYIADENDHFEIDKSSILNESNIPEL